MNPWIAFVKEWVKENNIPYSQAIKDPRVSEAYKRGKTQTVARNVAQGKLSDIAAKAKAMPPKVLAVEEVKPTRSAAQQVFDNPDLIKMIEDAKPEESWLANYKKGQRLRMEERYPNEMRLLKKSGLPPYFYNIYYQIIYRRQLADLVEVATPKKITTLLDKLDRSISKLQSLIPKEFDRSYDDDFMSGVTGIDPASFTSDDLGIEDYDEGWSRDAPDIIRDLIDSANELYEKYRPKKPRPAPVRRGTKSK